MSTKYYDKVTAITEENQYVLNQYEDHSGGRFYYGEMMNARYIKQLDPEYMGNPLIEALPPSYSIRELVKLIDKSVPFSVSERDLDVTYRCQAVARIKDLVFVMDKHLSIAQKIEMLIKGGYTSKNVPTPSFLRKAYLTADMLGNQFIEQDGTILSCIVNNAKAGQSGFSVLGVSGGGKTVALNNILSLYPQAIIHKEYQGDKILFKQLTWLKIDCTYNGNIKGICEKFFMNVDSILGTNYYKLNKGVKVDIMISRMAKVAMIHGLGCLVIDEIQHIAEGRNDVTSVMNFLVTLQNEIKIPMVFVGTYKAVTKVFNQDFRGIRRASGIGEVEWGFMKNDEEFELFLSKLWHYQWVKNPGPITRELIDTFHNATGGITERVIKIFMLSQIEAISSGEEQITTEIVLEMAREMPLTKEVIKAINSGDIMEIMKYDDLFELKNDGIVENKIMSIRESEELKKAMKALDDGDKKEDVSLRSELRYFAMQMDVADHRAEKLIDRLLTAENIHLKESQLKLKLAGLISELKTEESKVVEIKGTSPTFEDINIWNSAEDL